MDIVAMVIEARRDRNKWWPARKSYCLSIAEENGGTTKEISVARSEMQTTPGSRVELGAPAAGAARVSLAFSPIPRIE
jgi:hypothetical protein